MRALSILYKDAGHIVEYVGQGCKTDLVGGDHPPVRPCIGPAPGSKRPELADRVFCFYDMHGAGLSQRRRISEEMASQTTWEAFS